MKNLINKIPSALFRILYFLLALIVIIIFSYILGGHLYLVKGIWGTDTGSALSMIAWIDKYFPKVPFWYPKVAGGVSITHSYPVFSFYLVSFLKRVFSLELAAALRVLGFSSIVATAVGIYAFVATRFKNQTAAFIASIFFLISPISWTWIIDWGFYAENISFMFVVPAILFWDLFLTSFVKGERGLSQRLYLVLSSVFVSLTLLSHFGAGMGVATLFAFFVIGKVLVSKNKKIAFTRSIMALILVIALTALLTGFSTFSMFRYNKIAAWGGQSGGASLEAILQSSLSPEHVFGFRLPTRQDFLFAAKNISFVPVVSILALLGGIVYTFYKKSGKSLSFLVFGLFAVSLAFAPGFYFRLRNHIPFPFSGAFSLRYVLVSLRMILPILAALGVVGIFELIFFWLRGKHLDNVKKLIVAVSGILLFGVILFKFGNFPDQGDIYRFGPRGLDPGNIWDIKELEEKGTGLDLQTQLMLANWPEFRVEKWAYGDSRLRELLRKISKEDSNARVDFAPIAAGVSMIAPYFTLDNNLSQVHSYVPTSSLMLRFQGQQSNAFYLNEAFYGPDSNLINNWARWFGINYTFFASDLDTKVFQEGGWEVWDGSWEQGVLKFSEENRLVELSSKPAVLVISQGNLDIYDQFFRLAGHGVLPYKDAFIVRGREAVDSYSLEELDDFDLVLLSGYTYKNKSKADTLLTNYVKEGGSVFIDTGWQYTVPDWETKEDEKALEIIPFGKLVWKDLGKTQNYVLQETELFEGIDTSGFAPLSYQGNSWGVSTGETGGLKNWAVPVLSVDGYPLIVQGNYGKGKVVWSGMNIIPHAKQDEDFYWEEIELLAGLFSWLNQGHSLNNFSVSYYRDHPDKVEFTLAEDVPDGGFLLWKEAHHPDFKAKLVTSDKKIDLLVYRAGPGMTLIHVPKASFGDKIIYEYKKPLVEIIASLVSIATLLILIPLLIMERFIIKNSIFAKIINWGEKKLNFLFFGIWRKPMEWWGKDDEE